MDARLSAWLTLSALTSLGYGCGEAMPDVEDIQDPVAHTQEALRRIVATNETPGISYSVVTADSVVFEGMAGVTDAAGDTPVTRGTMFMAYSTTKALTAILVMQLVERGVMSLDAPLSTYLATHPYGDQVTVRMLLAHTAGVPNPAPLDWFFVEGEAMDRKAALARVLASSSEVADARDALRHAHEGRGWTALVHAAGVGRAGGRPSPLAESSDELEHSLRRLSLDQRAEALPGRARPLRDSLASAVSGLQQALEHGDDAERLSFAFAYALLLDELGRKVEATALRRKWHLREPD